jgi:hypothetical protein
MWYLVTSVGWPSLWVPRMFIITSKVKIHSWQNQSTKTHSVIATQIQASSAVPGAWKVAILIQDTVDGCFTKCTPCSSIRRCQVWLRWIPLSSPPQVINRFIFICFVTWLHRWMKISLSKTRQKESFTSHGMALWNVILIHHYTTKNLTSLKTYAQRENFGTFKLQIIYSYTLIWEVLLQIVNWWF